MTTKEKRLANTDIKISQHALVTFKFLNVRSESDGIALVKTIMIRVDSS